MHKKVLKWLDIWLITSSQCLVTLYFFRNTFGCYQKYTLYTHAWQIKPSPTHAMLAFNTLRIHNAQNISLALLNATVMT